MMPARFGVVKTAAVTDTMAQVTIMISNMWEKLGLKPEVMARQSLSGIPKDLTIRGVVWKHVGFQVEENTYGILRKLASLMYRYLEEVHRRSHMVTNSSIHEKTRFQDFSCKQSNGGQDDLCAATECKIR